MGNVDENDKKCKKCLKNNVFVREHCRKCYRKLCRTGEIKVKEKLLTPDKLTIKESDVLIGLLLGDGFLSNRKNSALRVNRSIKDEKYLLWQANCFSKFCATKPWRHDKKDLIRNKTYKGISFTTVGSNVFKIYRDKWYVNGIKIIPKDLIINNTIVAIWFCDDGCIYKNKQGYLNLKFATNGFKREEVEFLCNLLIKQYDAKFTYHKSGNGFVIKAAHYSTLKFIKSIKSFIPECMSRKLKDI